MRILDPNRLHYKRAFSDNEKCVFCTRDITLECGNLEGSFWRVVVNRYPYMDGNVMIIPKRHIERIEDVNQEEWIEFGSVLNETRRVLGQAFETDSFNIGMNLGPESGASIAHIHWQVIPRKMKNITVLNVLADVYIVAVSPEEAKRRIDAVYLT